MKKLFVILALGTFAACNSGESTTSTDSTSTVSPSTTVDTSATMGTVDTSAMIVDTTHADTTHK